MAFSTERRQRIQEQEQQQKQQHPSTPPADHDADDAPESVSLAEGKQLALDRIRGAKVAVQKDAFLKKSHRRSTDERLKRQHRSREERQRQAKLPSIDSKKIILPPMDESSETDNQEEEEVIVADNTRVIRLSDRRTAHRRVGQRRNGTVQNRMELFALHGRQRRVSPATSAAYRRLGRPASKFVLSREEEKEEEKEKEKRKQLLGRWKQVRGQEQSKRQKDDQFARKLTMKKHKV
jgi:hypothetical protein